MWKKATISSMKVEGARKDQKPMTMEIMPFLQILILQLVFLHLILIILKGGMLLKSKKGKQKVTESSHNSEFTEEYRAMRIVREKELELSERKIKEMGRFNKERDEVEKHKSYATILNTLLAKTHLTPAQEAMIEDLTEKVMGKTF
ncbi:hypothetical protein RND81_10G090000 [Saponaria officinalis]|uniref:Uncharacterized protein n=1 Tax=Saponaria officinalis TaxID=3572 RepID=A0AAW1HZZ9_SAPOF